MATKMHIIHQAFVLFAILSCPIFTIAEFVDMKVVDEPSSLGFQNSYGLHNQEEKLTLRVQPTNFSGPIHFKRLIGRCFHSILSGYKYSFCPYSNITQHEQDVTWNPYNGVLGVWQEWEVKNNTFTAMMMKDGDDCGDIHRSVKIMFSCGNHSEIVNVTEPKKCSYELLFMTPLVCTKDSMLVYPTLNVTLQHEWDLLEGEKAVGDLTEKGYTRRLDMIFEKAGIKMNPKKYQVLQTKEVAIHDYDTHYTFDSLTACNTGYRVLKEQNKALRYQLGGLRRNSGND